MFINQFPYSDFHELNLDWIISQIKKITAEMESYEATHKIIFADPIQWNITTQYAPFTIVSDSVSNASYISRKAVPSGILLTDTEYWTILCSLVIDPVARQEIMNLMNSTDARFATVTVVLGNINHNITDIKEDVSDIKEDVSDNTAAIASETSARTAADVTINARIDSIASLEEGSTTGDAELIDARIAYNGNKYPTAGDAIRGQIDSVYLDMDDITALTSNLFNRDDIIIGTNATGSANHPTRAISGPMHVGSNHAKITVLGIPSNIDFDVERYSSSEFSSRTGADGNIGFITETGTYTYSFADEYIRFLFRSRNSAALTPADFDGLKVQVNAGLVIPEYEGYKTAKDAKARREAAGIADAVNPYGLLPFTGYTNNSVSSGTHPYASSYLLSDYVKVNPYQVLKCTSGRTNQYVIAVSVYDTNKDWIKGSGYTELYTTGYKLGAGAEYVRFVVRKANADLSEFDPIYPTESVLFNQYVEDLKPSQITAELNICTFNVGRWCYGTGYGIPDDVYDEKLTNYRRFFGEQNFDIMGLNECDRLIDESQTIDCRDVLFNHWNYSNYVTGAWEAIFSKYPISGGHTGQLTTGRYFCDSYADINGKIVYLLAVHLSPGHGASDKVTRQTEMTEVMALVADKPSFIIFGDFNPEPDEYSDLYSMPKAAGYNIANTDFFGDYWTVTSNPADFDNYDDPSGTIYYTDNIITSADIRIDDAKAVNTYSKLTSDHIPIIAKITVS